MEEREHTSRQNRRLQLLVLPVCSCINIILGVFFGYTMQDVGPQFPGQGSNPGPQRWKHRVFTPGPPGKSQTLIFVSLSLHS